VHFIYTLSKFVSKFNKNLLYIEKLFSIFSMANLTYNFTYRSASNDVLVSTSDNSFTIAISSSTDTILIGSVLTIPVSPTASLKLSYYDFGQINGSTIQTLGLTDLLQIQTQLSVDCFKGATAGGGGSATATEATQVANGVKLDNILAEQKDDKFLAQTVWYDKNDVTKFYVRVTTLEQDTGTEIVTFKNVDGTVASPVPTASNLVQTVSQSDYELDSTLYEVVTSGTGYSIGDTVEEIKIIDTKLGTISATIYYNKNLATTITPVFTHLVQFGKYITPSHLDLTTGTANLATSTYKYISLIVMDGSCNITIDGITINNFPTNYTETWGNGNAILNKAISVTANTNSRIIINTQK
jgi:hypothetical protein